MQQERARQLLYDIILARLFERAAAEQYTEGNIAGFLHLYPGEEAVGSRGLWGQSKNTNDHYTLSPIHCSHLFQPFR